MIDQRKNWDDFWLNIKAKDKGISWSKQRILSILDPYVQRDHRVLDAGCGSGFFSAYFCSGGMDTTAVDYSDKSITLTRAITYNRAKIFKLDMMSNTFPENFNVKFDLIFNDGLFEHFIQAEQDILMNNFKSILNPTGHLISFVPNMFSPWTIIRPFFMPGIEEKPFTIKQLKNLNMRNGLHIKKYGGLNTLPWKISLEGHFAVYTGMLLYTISTLKNN